MLLRKELNTDEYVINQQICSLFSRWSKLKRENKLPLTKLSSQIKPMSDLQQPLFVKIKQDLTDMNRYRENYRGSLKKYRLKPVIEHLTLSQN